MNQQEQLQANQDQFERLQAAFAGIANDVNLSNKDWRGLMESGALASLSISRYRGHKALTADDLGIDQAEYDQVESIVNLGHRLLLPKATLGAFNSLESNSRQVLRRYTLKVPAGYFLPASAYDACATAMNDAKQKFQVLVDQLIVNLPTFRQEINANYWTLSDQVARRLRNAGILSSAATDQYMVDFVDRCMRLFPLESDLTNAFRFDLRLSFVPMPYATGQAESPSYAEPTNDLLALRRAVIAEQSRIENEEIRGFVQSIQSEVYTLVNDALTNVLDGIKDKGFLQSRSAVQLRGLTERLGQLNFWQDQRLELIKAEITKILDREPSKRDMQVDQPTLELIQNEVKATLLQLGTIERGDFDLSQPAPTISLPTNRQPAPLVVPATAGSRLATPTLATQRDAKRLF